jgi:hypothetical protein
MGLEATSRQMFVTTGIAGLAGLVLVAVSQALVQVGGAEPEFDAPAAEIQRFLEARNETLYAIGTVLGLIAVVALGFFVAGVCTALREVEDRPAWRSAVALVFGITFVALLMSPGWELAAYRIDDGVDPQIARYAFDMGNLGFANSWVALAGFLAAAGWIILESRSLPRWLGWLAVVAAVGFLAGRAFWTTPIWLIPYSLFWVWVVVLSVQMIRGRILAR